VTERLYYLDSHLIEFQASVVDRADNGKRIYLDRTAFYPASGGQPSDQGKIEGVPIVDLVDEGERVAHLLEQPVQGPSVTGQIDWDCRLDHMQQHTGQHVLSAVFADLLGHTTVSVHMGEHSSTVDLDAAQLSAAEAARVEERSNEIIAENRPVQVTFEDAATAIGLRKPTSRSGTIRVVTIEGTDRSACGGTHVSATGEIGCVLLRKTERIRKGIRIEFLCGLRAVRRSRSEAEILGRLAAELSCSATELPQLIAAQRAELKEAVTSRRLLQSELSLYQARELYSKLDPDKSGIRKAVVRWPNGPPEELRSLAEAFARLPQAVFVGAIQAPPTVVLSAAADSGIQAGSVLKGLLPTFGGRGGGSASVAQGALPTEEQLERVVSALVGTK